MYLNQDREDVVKVTNISQKSNIPFYLGKSALNIHLLNQKLLITGSASGLVYENVLNSAYGELVERSSSCISGMKNSAALNSYKVLKENHNINIVDPNDFIQHQPIVSKNQYRELQLCWSKVNQLISEKEFLVPSLIVFNQWHLRNDEVLFTYPDSCGMAAHVDRDMAKKSAFYEVIERDCLILSWRLKNLPLSHIPVSYVSDTLIKLCKDEDFIFKNYLISFANQPPVVLSMILDSNKKYLACGHSCNDSIMEAIEKAMCEALMIKFTLINKDKIRLNYPTSSIEHMKIAYHHSSEEIFSYYMTKPTIDFNENLFKYKHINLNFIQESYGESLFYIDISDENAANSNWHVFRAISIDACKKETNCFLMNIHSKRFKDLEAKFGPVNMLPHPFG